MPVITRFFGIVIKMYPTDHTPPPFHAIYGEYVGVIDIKTLKILEGLEYWIYLKWKVLKLILKTIV